MDEPRCETCQYFNPAHGGAERLTWGHCRQAVRPGDTKSLGLFTWADDVCEYVESRCGLEGRRPTSRITFIPAKRGVFDRLRRMSAQKDE